ncbi:S8 family serine peptidase [Belliella kenyensis]|uniref:S8 family serine peptidase n=1 Tax=Belliella kenyensis TaxID=1472724 RepID=A0ABV8EHI0_9BACT|nr:S8 family serine peptidase [Belliella kenyensis]MCH7403065.1 S8 family serine peptidase [Belliella kenyensis]MDN3602234.1 S8 family serine peptidase [Belliella kenyensis]
MGLLNLNKKKTCFAYVMLVLSCISYSCNSFLDDSYAELEEANILEEKLLTQGQLIDITDYSNLRVGDFTGHYILLSKSPNLSKNITQEIAKAGGEIISSYPQIGVVIAKAINVDFVQNVKKLNSVESITADYIVQYTSEPDQLKFTEMNDNFSEPSSNLIPFDYKSAFFDGFQWAPKAINADKAWEAGITGNGVRVAVIDGGFHSTHIDLSPNLDLSFSRSTVPGFNFNQDVGTFWHGTHVAGIIASSGLGAVGIAPRAKIIGIKSLHNGTGAFSWILEGLLYAATPIEAGGAGADIINMSLGATIDYRSPWGDKDFRDAFRELQKIYDRATRYAWQNGVTVIVSAGNGGNNYDVSKELFQLPAQSQHALSISSTGPTGWGFGASNFFQPAYYTDHGKSLVDFAAPGGTVGLALVDGNFNPCTILGTYTSSTNTCAVFDQVFSTIRGTSNGSFGWSQGTSMAAPAVAGVVALMMEAESNRISPSQVRAKLRQSSEDLGAPGNDAFYGHGFVNAAKAIGIN